MVFRFLDMESREKKIRRQLGLTQDEMATWLGMGRSLYSMIEAGKRSWPLGTQAFERFYALNAQIKPHVKKQSEPGWKEYQNWLLPEIWEEYRNQTEEKYQCVLKALKDARAQEEQFRMLAGVLEKDGQNSDAPGQELLDYCRLKMQGKAAETMNVHRQVIRLELERIGLEAQLTFIHKKMVDTRQ